MKPDSLIFDMDGTLWDAVDTYALAWNQGFHSRGIEKRMSRQTFSPMMGWERKKNPGAFAAGNARGRAGEYL